MAIVCGTDFTKHSVDVSCAAGALARRLNEPLVLFHAVYPLAIDPVSAESAIPSLVEAAEKRIEVEAEAVRSSTGATVTCKVLVGYPDRILTEISLQEQPVLAVVGASDHRNATDWLVGSVSDTAVQSAPVPLLLVKNAEPIIRAATEGRPLRVVFGTDLGHSSEGAMNWISKMRKRIACDVVLVYVAWPPADYTRLGITGADPTTLHPVVTEVLERDLAKLAQKIEGSGEVRTLVRPTLGRTSEALMQLGDETGCDVILTGTHQRRWLSRMWHGSVTWDLLHASPKNILCVPPDVVKDEQREPVPKIHTVLAAIDFSQHSDRAIAYAFSIAPKGSRVVLCHVVDTETFGARTLHGKESDEAKAKLKGLIPAEVGGVDTDVEVLEGAGAARMICAAAERLDCDVICVGSHGRTGLPRAMLGSVAQEVMMRSHRPVLVVTPEAE